MYLNNGSSVNVFFPCKINFKAALNLLRVVNLLIFSKTTDNCISSNTSNSPIDSKLLSKNKIQYFVKMRSHNNFKLENNTLIFKTHTFYY